MPGTLGDCAFWLTSRRSQITIARGPYCPNIHRPQFYLTFRTVTAVISLLGGRTSPKRQTPPRECRGVCFLGAPLADAPSQQKLGTANPPICRQNSASRRVVFTPPMWAILLPSHCNSLTGTVCEGQVALERSLLLRPVLSYHCGSSLMVISTSAFAAMGTLGMVLTHVQ